MIRPKIGDNISCIYNFCKSLSSTELYRICGVKDKERGRLKSSCLLHETFVMIVIFIKLQKCSALGAPNASTNSEA